MDNGWIKIHRSVYDHWIFKDADKFKAWITILGTVNHKDKKVLIGDNLIDCNRGQCILSLDSWAKKFGLGWNKSKVRRFFKLLENDHMIVTENVTKTTRITVCKYDSYQDERNESETKVKRKRNKDETIMTPTKECKERKNNNILMSEAKPSDVSERNRPYFELAKSYYKLFEINSSQLGVTWNHLKKARAEKYSNDIRLMVESDKREEQDLIEVGDFLKRDKFWMQNIQSTDKLREKFDQLITKSKTSRGTKTQTLTPQERQQARKKLNEDYKRIVGC